MSANETGDFQYRHCVICENKRTVWRKNKISGHEWPEYIRVGGYHVVGGYLAQRHFRTIKKAKEAIDFDYEVKCGKFAHLKHSTAQLGAS